MKSKKRALELVKKLEMYIQGEEGKDLHSELVELLSSNDRPSRTTSGPRIVEFPAPFKDFPAHENTLAVFSDGACRGNPGPGGWGVICQDVEGSLVFQSSGFEPQTTNNRMELAGAIYGLKMILDLEDYPKSHETHVELFSDSKYVVDGILKWVPGWKNRGWKKADKKTPENLDLWQELDDLCAKFSQVGFHWVKGHSGHPQNEYCDQLANEAMDSALNL